MSATEPPIPPAGDGDAPERQTTPFLVLQFFIFPMAIVAVCVAVFVIFGLVASEGKGARDYVAEVRTGGVSRRWQAAFELSKALQSGKEAAVKDERFVQEIISLYDESGNDDPRVRRYLAVALGRVGDRRAVPSLLRTLATAGADPETVIYSVWALGAIGDATAAPALVKLAASEDRGLRKAAVHALGSLPSPETRAVLEGALADAVDDVRWNAALSLARQGDAAAGPVLAEMMDRSRLARVEGITPDQMEEAVLQAVAASATLPSPDLLATLGRLRESDPSLKIREAARRALERQPRPAR
jgi:HEAT repeat protein